MATRSFCGKIEGKVNRKVDRGGAGNTPRSVTMKGRFMMLDYSTLPLFSLQPETREIPLTQGKVAIVDATDYEWLIQWKWYARCDYLWYAARQSSKSENKPMTVYMHREIMAARKGETVDHYDGNGLNNTRANLRFATIQQNNRNSRLSTKNTSGYKGVSFDKRNRKWKACIYVNRKQIYIGLYSTPEEAASAYDEAAKRHFSQFARLNFRKD